MDIDNDTEAGAESIPQLRVRIAACRVCAAHLPLGCRPVVQIGSGARSVIIGQAPGTKVHASGVPWDDASGERLREWLGIGASDFYDPEQIALTPMGFCYPGVVPGGGDKPPRPECAPLWHERIGRALPQVRLTLLIGLYAQATYLGSRRGSTLTDTVRRSAEYLPRYLPLPHPSWRSTGWMRRNPWFEADILPILRSKVAESLIQD